MQPSKIRILKISDLLFVQQTVIHTLHRNGKVQIVILLEGGCVQSAACQKIQ